MLRTVFILMAALIFAMPALADELHLANGRVMTGLVTEETPWDVTLDVGIGTVKVQRSKILKIEKSDTEEAEDLQMNWADKRLEDDVRRPVVPMFRTRSAWGKK